MRNYEVNFIVDPVLSSDEIKATAQTYIDHLKKEGCEIVHIDEMGLRQLAYPINKRSTGIYYCVEFKCETGELIEKLELTFRRDERIIRFLTVALDKFAIKFNEDKRNGLIGKKKKKATVAADAKSTPANSNGKAAAKPKPAPAKSAPVKAATPAPAPVPVAETANKAASDTKPVASEEEE